MPKITLPGPVGEWTEARGDLSRPDGQKEYYFPLDHGFGLKVRKRGDFWIGCIYTWRGMAHHDLDGVQHAVLEICQNWTRNEAVKYFCDLADLAGITYPDEGPRNLEHNVRVTVRDELMDEEVEVE